MLLQKREGMHLIRQTKPIWLSVNVRVNECSPHRSKQHSVSAIDSHHEHKGEGGVVTST